MQSEYAKDHQDENTAIREAAAERPGKSIKMRLQPYIFRLPEGYKTGQYRSWRDVHWTLEFDSADEAMAFGKALQLFFTALNRQGLPAVTARLRAGAKEDAA